MICMEGATVQPAMSDEEVTTVVAGNSVVKTLVVSMALDKGARAAKVDSSSCSLHRPMLLIVKRM